MRIIVPTLLFSFLMFEACNRNHSLCYTDEFAGLFYGFTELEPAVKCAKEQKKSLLLLFDNYSTNSTPGLIWKTLALYEDRELIQDRFVIVCLYEDNPKKLKDTSRIQIFEHGQFAIKTVGDKNFALEIELLNSNATGIFCIVDTNMKKYGRTLSFTRNKQEVQNFIESGMNP